MHMLLSAACCPSAANPRRRYRSTSVATGGIWLQKPLAFCFEVLWNEEALDSEDKCGLDQTAELLER